MTPRLLGVAEIAAAVTSRELSAAEVVADHIAKAQTSQEHLNSFTLIEQEAALEAAVAIDRRLEAGTAVGPLAGVPIALKDLIDHAGRPNTAGSGYPPAIPAESATVVRRLEDAGAVVIGRTGLHEYAFGFSSENDWFGPVRNPWDTDLSPGGSSGGSAVAVAAGLAAAALGTDTGGSIRVPAALCGIVGLKVTHGRVPLTGVFPLASSIDTVGPLGRDVADTQLIYLVIAGHDSTDPWSAPRQLTLPGDPTNLREITIGVPHPWVDLPQTEPVSASFTVALGALAAAGSGIKHLELPNLVPTAELEHSVYPEVAVVHEQRWHDHRETYGPDVSRRLGEVFEIDSAAYIRAREWRARTRHTAEAALQECDFLITPTVGAAVKPIGVEQIEIAGKLQSYRPQLSRYSALVNHMSLPALALPLDMDGVPPPSIQLIGRRWSEHQLLEMGFALELLGLSGYRRPPFLEA